MTVSLYTRVTPQVRELVVAIATETGESMSTVVDGLLRKALGVPVNHRVSLDAAIAHNQWKDDE